MSATEATAGTTLEVAARPRRRQLWPAPTLALALYLCDVVPRLYHNGPFWFVHLGSGFLRTAASANPSFSGLPPQSNLGYDGQFYFAVATDPTRAHQYLHEPFVTSPGYVYSRIGYPGLARLLGFGSAEGVAYAMLLINLAAVLLGTLAVAAWLRRRNVSPWFALLYGLYPGLIFAVSRDLTEPLAFGLAAASVWMFDRRGRWSLPSAAALMALSLLTRETTGLFALALAWALVAVDRRTHRGAAAVRRGALFLAAALLPLFAWRLFVAHSLGAATQERPGGSLGYLIPFHAYAAWWPWQPMRTLVVAAVTVPALATAVAVLACWRRTRERWPLLLFLLNAFAFVAYLPQPVLVDYGAAGRAALGVVLAFVYSLPVLLRARVVGRLLALAWSPVSYVAAALLLGWPAPLPIS